MAERKKKPFKLELYGENRFYNVFIPILAVLFALLLGTIILLLIKRNPVEAYGALWKGAVGDLPAIGDTLARATPIIFTGLAITFAFRCGLFNIGVEGQLIIGSLAAALTGHYLKNIPSVLHVTICVLAAALAGSVYAALPGILKAWRGVHEVITTIMLNYISYSIAAYVIEKTRIGAVPKTPAIQESAMMPKLGTYFSVFQGSMLNVGFILAIGMLILVSFIFRKTVLGYEVRAVGFNPLAAEDGGIAVRKRLVTAMLISGAIAGLGGAERVLGVHEAYIHGLSPGYGFEGVAVSLLGNNTPIGVLLSGILFGGLSSGSLYMDMSADVPADIIVIIQAIIIFFVSANMLIKRILYKVIRTSQKRED